MGRLRLTRVHLRLTTAGWLYIGLCLVLGIVAVNAANNLLYLSVAGLLSLLALSGVLGLANLRGLEARVRITGEVYAGQPATAFLELHNLKRRLPTWLVTCRGCEAEGSLVELLPGERLPLPVSLRFDRRGRRPLGSLEIRSPFPFGLIVRGGSYDTGETCLVYPKPEPVRWDLLEQAERQGDESTRSIAGTGGDYRGVREYLPGDTLSRVHWKGWLRHRRLMTKEFEAEGAPSVTFSFDAVPGPGTEERLSQLSWLVRTALRRGRAVGLVLPARRFPPGAGPAHRKELLTALALHGEEP